MSETFGRNSCLYKIAGTTTFRLASKKLPNGRGTNLQNVEKSSRIYYVPDPGKVFVQVDQSGAEALVVAYLCKHGNFRDLFLNGIKSHVYVALHVFADQWQKRLNKSSLDVKFDIEPFLAATPQTLTSVAGWKDLDKLIKSSDDWPSNERYYYIAKMICHASNYGMRPPAFQLNVLEKSEGRIVLTKEQSTHYLLTYHGLFCEIKEWHQEVFDAVSKTRTLFNLFGFPRAFTSALDETNMKDAIAFVPQSTVGTITNIAYTQLQNYIEDTNRDWDLLANTHDSYLCQCPPAEAEECAKMMKYFIEQDLTSPRGEKFKMKSEAKKGLNWAPFHPEKNPLGLVDIKGI
jgi:DNA polymerase I-like protein with 3'-5' exonuclease and polymerase domains